MRQFPRISKLSELDRFILTRESLDTSEFEVFRTAYKEWYGETAAMPYLEEQFDEYLKSGELPFYVRHYCRSYLEKHPLCVTAAQRQERRRRITGWIVTGLLILFVTTALLLS